jgi:hypothetical protein
MDGVLELLPPHKKSKIGYNFETLLTKNQSEEWYPR